MLPPASLRARRIAVAFMLLAPGTGCRSAVESLGPTPASARANAEQMFGALGARFDEVQRAPKFAYAREQLGRWAFIPSKIWNDTAVWTSVADTARTMVLQGALTGGHYVMTPHAAAHLPDRAGDSRHLMRLRWLGESDYDWYTAVDHAMGTVRAAGVAELVSRLFASAEGRHESELRAEYRAAFPNASRVLGALISLDTLRTTVLPDGSTSVQMAMKIDPNRIRSTSPNYAKYLDKYIGSAKLRFVLRDGQGGTYFDTSVDHGVIAVRYRVRDGSLVTLTGPPRIMPDSLELVMDAQEKFMIFHVGFTNLVGDFTIVRGEHDRAWFVRWRKEPEWNLPLFAARMIRSPLRRPFQGEGAMLRLGIYDAPNGQSMLYRRGSVAVRESGILRWLGGLGFTAMSEFMGKAEDEENRFNAEVLYALRADALGMFAGN